MFNTRRLFCIGILVLVGCLLVSCGKDTSPESTTSPLSPLATSIVPSDASPVTDLETGQVYAARFQGAWASGYPYPIFFIDVPPGTTELVVEEVVYGAEEPLNAVHPRLNKVAQKIEWPSGGTSQVLATDFYYDETQGSLLAYSAAQDGTSIDTVAYDVSSSSGVGISFLGDTGGPNIFFNCPSPTSINYQALATNEAGKPTQAIFDWACEGDSYTVEVEATWGKSDAQYGIDVIDELTAKITRG